MPSCVKVLYCWRSVDSISISDEFEILLSTRLSIEFGMPTTGRFGDSTRTVCSGHDPRLVLITDLTGCFVSEIRNVLEFTLLVKHRQPYVAGRMANG